MRKNFRAYQRAVEFHRMTRVLELEGHLRMQLSRAASSVTLNLAEGEGRQSKRDQARFFRIAFGSLRECQAILILAGTVQPEILEAADILAAHIYRLIQAVRGG